MVRLMSVRLSGCAIFSVRFEVFLEIWRATPPPTSPTSVVAAAGNWLLDTGPLVALLSADDSAHRACADAFEAIRGKLLTTEAVLTEALHLLRRRPEGSPACIEFFRRGGALLVPI